MRRLGSKRSLSLGSRVIAATHRNLGLLLNEGSSRTDFYFPLKVFAFRLAPLRERGEDILPPAQFLFTERGDVARRVVAPLWRAHYVAHLCLGGCLKAPTGDSNAVLLRNDDAPAIAGVEALGQGYEAAHALRHPARRGRGARRPA